MKKDEMTKLIEATQDGRDLSDGHPISELIKWAIENSQAEDFDISLTFSELEYAINQLEQARVMIKLLRHVSSDRY